MNDSNEELENMLRELPLVEPSAELDHRMDRLFAQAQTSSAYRISPVARWGGSIAASFIAAVAVGWVLGYSHGSGGGNSATSGPQIAMTNSSGSAGSSDSANPLPVNPMVSVTTPVLHETSPKVQVGESQVVDEGYSDTPTGVAVHVLRKESTQRSTWVDPVTKAKVQVDVPDDEVVLISAPTY